MKLGIGRRQPVEDLNVAECPGAKALNLTAEQVDGVLEEIDEVFNENREFFIG